MLARTGQLGRGGRAWQEQPLGASIARSSPTEMLYGNQPPTVDIPMVWRTAHLGYGDEMQRGEGRYRYGVNVDARFPLQIIPGPHVTTLTISGSANVNGFFEQGGNLFVIAGRYCKKIAADDTVTLEQDFGEGNAATDCAVYDGTAYVGLGYSTPFWKRSAAGAWSQASGLYMGHLAAFKDRMWASVAAAQVSAVSADPTVAANWGYIVKVGDPSVPITSMTEQGDLLHIGKEDGLYALGESGVAKQITPELRAWRNEANCVGMRGWHGTLWVPHVRGCLNYKNLGSSGFLVTPTTPGDDLDPENPVRGQVTALAGDNKWLYVALYTPDGDTYILAGRTAYGDEQAYGMMLWHPWVKLASTKVDAMHISGLWTNPRLFLGTGVNVGYIILPRSGDNPLNDTACRYQTSGSIYFPAHSWGTPTTTKLWNQIEIMGEGLNLARYVEVYYRVDGGAWVYAGKATLPTRHVIGLADEGVSGQKIEVRLDYTVPNNQAYLLIRSVVVRGVERPKMVKLYTVVIRAADNLALRGSMGTCSRTGAQIVEEVEALALAARAVVLKDPVGTEKWVMVQSATPTLAESAAESDLPREMLVTLRMTEFEADESELGEVEYMVWGEFKWGDGSVWA